MFWILPPESKILQGYAIQASPRVSSTLYTTAFILSENGVEVAIFKFEPVEDSAATSLATSSMVTPSCPFNLNTARRY